MALSAVFLFTGLALVGKGMGIPEWQLPVVFIGLVSLVPFSLALGFGIRKVLGRDN